MILAGFLPFLCSAQSCRHSKTRDECRRKRGHVSSVGRAHDPSCFSSEGRLCSLGMDHSCASHSKSQTKQHNRLQICWALASCCASYMQGRVGHIIFCLRYLLGEAGSEGCSCLLQNHSAWSAGGTTSVLTDAKVLCLCCPVV